MKVALLAPIAWRTPPKHYGPWENIVSLICEGLVNKGIDVTLFATADSVTEAKLNAVCPHPYEETPDMNVKVWECLHISNVFEHADQFDVIHNHFDFLPLSYSKLFKTPMVTTIHGFSSPSIIPIYKKYQDNNTYISISNADRSPELKYLRTVYHGINLDEFTFNPNPEHYILYLGRIHPDKGTADAIQIAKASNQKLILAGIIQDHDYFKKEVEPHLKDPLIDYVGSVGPKERNKLLGSAQAMLHPIFFEEPFGLSVVESMACGTPVIAYSKGSMPEIIVHEKNGFLTQTVEEAVSALENISTIQRSDCRKHVEKNFSRERMVKEYIEVYEEVLKRRHRP